MIFKYRMHNNPKLAEQLMFGSSDDKVNKINKKLWEKFNGNRFDYYLYIVKLCGKPISARARYVIAMAYSWNSVIYYREAIKYLEIYLSKPLYKEQCINNGTYTTKERTKIHLTTMYNYLGKAYESNDEYDKAIQTYKNAINISPNVISSYLNLANSYGIKKEYTKAINLLEIAKNSQYAKKPTGYEKGGELFLNIDLLNEKIAIYKNLLYIETAYPYKQKQVREMVMVELQKNNININFTQPKLKLICDQFNLKNKKEYFYKYPYTDNYRCSKKLIDLLVNSLINNPNLINEIKK